MANEMVPFLVVAKMSESIEFYVDGLGFNFVDEWRPDGNLKWCMLQLAGARLMLQQDASEDERVARGRGVRLCVMCDDAVGLYHQFVAQNITPDEPYVGNGLWVTGVVDPDGYFIDFESPTDQPEDTVLSELVDQP